MNTIQQKNSAFLNTRKRYPSLNDQTIGEKAGTTASINGCQLVTKNPCQKKPKVHYDNSFHDMKALMGDCSSPSTRNKQLIKHTHKQTNTHSRTHSRTCTCTCTCTCTGTGTRTRTRIATHPPTQPATQPATHPPTHTRTHTHTHTLISRGFTSRDEKRSQ